MFPIQFRTLQSVFTVYGWNICDVWPDMFHALWRFIFKRQFWQNVIIYGTSNNCAGLSIL